MSDALVELWAFADTGTPAFRRGGGGSVQVLPNGQAVFRASRRLRVAGAVALRPVELRWFRRREFLKDRENQPPKRWALLTPA